MSHALGIANIQVLLADVTWIKHNRSINQFFTQKEFMNQLRVCLDKRIRICKVLNLEYTVFGISDNNNSNSKDLSKADILKHSKNFRNLAELFWGKKSLEPQREDMLKIIGQTFDKISKSKKDLPELPSTIARLIDLKDGEIAKAIEEKLQSEFRILRTISKLFSSFDEDIFLYYFAQYSAQTHFKNSLKIAPKSEEKFDQPFLECAKDFDNVITRKLSSENESKPITGYIYCPQYELGGYKILPYCSVSGDVAKKLNDNSTVPNATAESVSGDTVEKQNVIIEEFKGQTILLDDSYDNQLEKIKKVVAATKVQHKNRLLSDLLSFIHFLFQQNVDEKRKQSILQKLEAIYPDIHSQIKSTEDTPSKYTDIFSDWIQSIDKSNSVPPFHIIPYLWEESDWDQHKNETVATLIFALLELVNDICE